MRGVADAADPADRAGDDAVATGRMLGTREAAGELAAAVAVERGDHVIGGYDRASAVGATKVPSPEVDESDGVAMAIASAAAPPTATSAAQEDRIRPAPM